MRELALFAGAGGGILGGETAWMAHRVLVEIDPYARRVLLADKQMDALADSQSGTTCGHSTERDGGELSMSLAEDSHVRTSVQPERERASQEQSPVCGRTWHALSVRFDLDSCLWKTARSLFPEVLPWSLVILPRWGMMRDGACWERIMSELPKRHRLWIVAYHGRRWGQDNELCAGRDELGIRGAELANADSKRKSQSERRIETQRRRFGDSGEKLADSDKQHVDGWRHGASTTCGQRQDTANLSGSKSIWWQFEPDVGRVANGVARGVDRLRCLEMDKFRLWLRLHGAY